DGGGVGSRGMRVMADGEQPARPRAASFAQRSCFHLASTAKAHGSNFQDHLGEIDQAQRLTGAPEEIRTPDPQIRSKILSPDRKRHYTTGTDADPGFIIDFPASL